MCRCGESALALWRACPAGCHAPRGWRGLSPGAGNSHRCGARLVSGALPLPAACPLGGYPSSFACAFWARVLQAWGPSTSPTACALASRRCALYGRRENVPRGDASRRCAGASGVKRSSSACCPSLGQAIWVRSPVAMAAGVRLWGAVTGSFACVPYGVSRAAGVAGGSPGGGVPLTVVRVVCCQALFPSQPPVPSAGSRGLLPAYSGLGWCGLGDPAPVRQGALLPTSRRASPVRCPAML